MASQITGEEFLNQLDDFAQSWLPARDIVQAALDQRFEIDQSGSVIVFNQASQVKSSHLSTIHVLRVTFARVMLMMGI